MTESRDSLGRPGRSQLRYDRGRILEVDIPQDSKDFLAEVGLPVTYFLSLRPPVAVVQLDVAASVGDPDIGPLSFLDRFGTSDLLAMAYLKRYPYMGLDMNLGYTSFVCIEDVSGVVKLVQGGIDRVTMMNGTLAQYASSVAAYLDLIDSLEDGRNSFGACDEFEARMSAIDPLAMSSLEYFWANRLSDIRANI